MKPSVILTLTDMGKVIESLPCEDIFCTHVISIQQVGPCHRLTLGVPEGVYDGTDIIRTAAKVMLSDEALRALFDSIPHYYALLSGNGRREGQHPNRNSTAVN
jgi:hypothetical protein